MQYDPKSILQSNVHKKIAKMEHVVSEMSYLMEFFHFQKEQLSKYYQKEIESIFLGYYNKIQAFNSDIDTQFQSLLQPIHNKYDKLYEDLYMDFAHFKDDLTHDMENYENKQIEQLNENANLVKNYSTKTQDFLKFVDEHSLESLKKKIDELNKKLQLDKEEIDKECENKCSQYQMKEEIDGLEILKAYEKMVADLKAKLCASSCQDPEIIAALRNIRDLIYFLKEGMRHARKKLLGIQSVSGSNITGFIQRKEKYIEAYKIEFEKNKKEENELMDQYKEMRNTSDREYNKYEEERNLKESEYYSEYNDIVNEFEMLKEKNQKEMEEAEEKSKTMYGLHGEISDMKDGFMDEETDLESATKVSQESISRRIDLLIELIASTKEKNQKEIEQVKYDTIITKGVAEDKHSEEKAQKEEEYKQEIEAFLKDLEKRKNEAEEARERADRMVYLVSEKEDLQELIQKINLQFNEDIKKIETKNDNIENVDIENYKEIFHKEINEAEMKNNEIIKLMEEEMKKQIENKHIEYDDLLHHELEKIEHEYQNADCETEKIESEKYANLVKEFENLKIVDENQKLKDLDDEYESLIQRKKDLRDSRITQRTDLHTHFSTEMSNEDERYQQSLMSLISYEQDGGSSLFMEIRKQHENAIQPLNEEYNSLSDEFKRALPTHCEFSMVVENTEEVQKLREELRRVKKEKELKLHAKEIEIAALMSEDVNKNEEKKKEILDLVENQRINFESKTKARSENIEKMNASLANISVSYESNAEFAKREFELNWDILKKKGETKINVLKKQIEIIKESYEKRLTELPKERQEQRVKLDNYAFDYSNLVQTKLAALYEKRTAFINQYDSIIQERVDNINILKEAYKNKPLGEKEKQALDTLTQKKKYLDNLTQFEFKTVKKYVNLEKKQETDFNERFGNKLNVATLPIKNTKKRSNSSLYKSDPLPPLPSPNGPLSTLSQY